jgi:hypothetical protein
VHYPVPRPDFARTLSRKYKKLWLIEIRGEQGDRFEGLSRYYALSNAQSFPGVQVAMFSRRLGIIKSVQYAASGTRAAGTGERSVAGSLIRELLPKPRTRGTGQT